MNDKLKNKDELMILDALDLLRWTIRTKGLYSSFIYYEYEEEEVKRLIEKLENNL